ncbi:MAG: retropepsin-like aspartic protease [Vulcanimicrobiaceae bacterium]|jgi:predicted aspartyl protease
MIRRVALLLAALLACSAAATADDTVPDSATIRAKVAAAMGPLPTAYHETDETTSSGELTAMEYRAVRGQSWRHVYNSGPFHFEEGLDKAQAWHQNDNGQTILDQPDPGFATSETTTTTVSRVHTPVEAYVIATLDAQGYGTKQYVDPTTWQTVRRERIEANGIETTTYDDVRLDHDRTFAHHWHIVDPISETAEDVRVTAYDHDPVTDEQVAIAPPLRALVTVPGGADSVTLPTQFTDSDVIVRVTINGRGLDFILDTGADGIYMDLDVAKQLGLPFYGRSSAVVAQRFTTARTIVPEMHVGNLVMRNVAVQLAPQGWDAGPYVKAVGLLGFDFLAELGVTIDYEHQRVTVVPGGAYVPPTDPHTIALDVRIGGGAPHASVRINGALGERWILDTGHGGTFMIFDYFARRHPEAVHDEHNWGAHSDPVVFSGVGGEFDTRPYVIANLQLSNLDFVDVLGYRVMSKGSYDWDDDGLIGSSFLRLFTVGLDYGNSSVYLVPTKSTLRSMHPGH